MSTLLLNRMLEWRLKVDPIKGPAFWEKEHLCAQKWVFLWTLAIIIIICLYFRYRQQVKERKAEIERELKERKAAELAISGQRKRGRPRYAKFTTCLLLSNKTA